MEFNKNINASYYVWKAPSRRFSWTRTVAACGPQPYTWLAFLFRLFAESSFITQILWPACANGIFAQTAPGSANRSPRAFPYRQNLFWFAGKTRDDAIAGSATAHYVYSCVIVPYLDLRSRDYWDSETMRTHWTRHWETGRQTCQYYNVCNLTIGQKSADRDIYV